MANRFKTVLLFGAPGSGKGTQGRILGTIPGFFHCACGDVFRQIETRIRIFTALPLERLSRLAIQHEVEKLGTPGEAVLGKTA